MIRAEWEVRKGSRRDPAFRPGRGLADNLSPREPERELGSWAEVRAALAPNY